MIRDLTLIILGVVFSYAYFYWQQYKDKKEIKKQERQKYSLDKNMKDNKR